MRQERNVRTSGSDTKRNRHNSPTRQDWKSTASKQPGGVLFKDGYLHPLSGPAERDWCLGGRGGGGLGNYSQVVDIKSMEFHVFKEKKKGLHTTLLPYAALNTNAPMYLILPLLLPQPHYFIETL